MRLAVNMPLKNSKTRSLRIYQNHTHLLFCLKTSKTIYQFPLGTVTLLWFWKEKTFGGNCKCLHHNWQWLFFLNTSKITSESLALVARVTKHCSYCTLQDPIKSEKYGWEKKAHATTAWAFYTQRNRRVLVLQRSGKVPRKRKWIYYLLHFNYEMMSSAQFISISIRRT